MRLYIYMLPSIYMTVINKDNSIRAIGQYWSLIVKTHLYCLIDSTNHLFVTITCLNDQYCSSFVCKDNSTCLNSRQLWLFNCKDNLLLVSEFFYKAIRLFVIACSFDWTALKSFFECKDTPTRSMDSIEVFVCKDTLTLLEWTVLKPLIVE
jgi:hypothetical protein